MWHGPRHRMGALPPRHWKGAIAPKQWNNAVRPNRAGAKPMEPGSVDPRRNGNGNGAVKTQP